jgi:hypothetical protein
MGGHLEGLIIDERMILKLTIWSRIEGRDWIHLAQDRHQWLALVDTVMNPPFP